MTNVIKKATNEFTKGLVMDFSPENTQNEVLTHALNATLLTFNGNELSLQNDMGNARVEKAFLPEGYVPVGSCEFGGVIYVTSYNQETGKGQIGSFPSPQRTVSSKYTSLDYAQNVLAAINVINDDEDHFQIKLEEYGTLEIEDSGGYLYSCGAPGVTEIINYKLNDYKSYGISFEYPNKIKFIYNESFPGNNVIKIKSGLYRDETAILKISSNCNFSISGKLSHIAPINAINEQLKSNPEFSLDIFKGNQFLIDASNLKFDIDATLLPQWDKTIYHPFNNIYKSFFEGCTNLVTGPTKFDIPEGYILEENVNPNSFEYFFKNCRSLRTSFVSLPKTFGAWCYLGMFEGCESLTQAPELPATNLSFGCYRVMFNGCSSLTQAPELPAETLVDDCYYQMFKDCINLTYCKINAKTINGERALYQMFNRCDKLNKLVLSFAEVKDPTNFQEWVTSKEGTCLSPIVDRNLIELPIGWNFQLNFFIKCISNVTIKLNDELIINEDIFCTKPVEKNEDGTIDLEKNAVISINPKNISDKIIASCDGLIEIGGSLYGFYKDEDLPNGLFEELPIASAEILELVGTNYTNLFKNCKQLEKSPMIVEKKITAPGMFEGCVKLSESPSMELVNSTCVNMFKDCQNLKDASNITIGDNCSCQNMFYNCQALEIPPKLNGTELNESCYQQMFENCTSLTYTPEFTGTILTNQCYYRMFKGCENLKTVSKLEVEQLATQCFEEMFNGCNNVNYIDIKILQSTNNVAEHFKDWISSEKGIYKINDDNIKIFPEVWVYIDLPAEIESQQYAALIELSHFIQNGKLRTREKLYQITDFKLYPGDRFQVLGSNIKLNYDKLYNFEYNGVKFDDAFLNLSYCIKNDLGTYEELNVQSKQDGYVNYIIKEYNGEEDSNFYVTLDSKTSGYLYLKAELVLIDEFLVNIIPYYNSYGNIELKIETVSNSSKFEIKKGLVTYKIYKEENQKWVPTISEIKPTENLNLKIVPVMWELELEDLAVYKTIEVDKINSGLIELNEWRYFNDEEITLKFGIDFYPRDDQKFKNIVLKFFNHTNLTTPVKELIFNDVGSYIETLQFDDQLKINNLYLVEINVNYIEILQESEYISTQKYYRWMYTSDVFNDYYISNLDYDQITPEIKIDINFNTSFVKESTKTNDNEETSTLTYKYNLTPASKITNIYDISIKDVDLKESFVDIKINDSILSATGKNIDPVYNSTARKVKSSLDGKELSVEHIMKWDTWNKKEYVSDADVYYLTNDWLSTYLNLFGEFISYGFGEHVSNYYFSVSKFDTHASGDSNFLQPDSNPNDNYKNYYYETRVGDYKNNADLIIEDKYETYIKETVDKLYNTSTIIPIVYRSSGERTFNLGIQYPYNCEVNKDFVIPNIYQKFIAHPVKYDYNAYLQGESSYIENTYSTSASAYDYIFEKNLQLSLTVAECAYDMDNYHTYPTIWGLGMKKENGDIIPLNFFAYEYRTIKEIDDNLNNGVYIHNSIETINDPYGLNSKTGKNIKTATNLVRKQSEDGIIELMQPVKNMLSEIYRCKKIVKSGVTEEKVTDIVYLESINDDITINYNINCNLSGNLKFDINNENISKNNITPNFKLSDNSITLNTNIRKQINQSPSVDEISTIKCFINEEESTITSKTIPDQSQLYYLTTDLSDKSTKRLNLMDGNFGTSSYKNTYKVYEKITEDWLNSFKDVNFEISGLTKGDTIKSIKIVKKFLERPGSYVDSFIGFLAEDGKLTFNENQIKINIVNGGETVTHYVKPTYYNLSGNEITKLPLQSNITTATPYDEIWSDYVLKDYEIDLKYEGEYRVAEEGETATHIWDESLAGYRVVEDCETATHIWDESDGEIEIKSDRVVLQIPGFVFRALRLYLDLEDSLELEIERNNTNVTGLGKWLKLRYINEIPQIVLKNEYEITNPLYLCMGDDEVNVEVNPLDSGYWMKMPFDQELKITSEHAV